MTKRIFRSIFGVSFTILLFLAVTVTVLLYNYNYKIFRDRIRDEALLLSVCINESGNDFLASADSLNGRITLIDKDGQVIFDNYAHGSELENHEEREEFILAQMNGEGESFRYSKTFSELTNYYAVKLNDGSVIRVSDTHYTFLSLFVRLMPPIIVFVALSFILSLTLSSKIAKKIVKPINEMDLENPDSFTEYDEIAPLINKIRHLTVQVDSHILELKQKKQEFDAITENMSEGFLIIDKNTYVLSSNSAALRLLGVKSVESNESVLKINRSIDFTNAVESAIAGKRCEYAMPFGGRVYQIIANPVFDENGSTLAAVLVILDVTDREKADKLRREFTANVSHELKTPLTSISGFAEIMMNGVAKEEDMQHFAGNIYSEAQRLINLVGDIIKLSRLDENSTPLEKEEINLLELSKSIIKRLQPQAEKKNIKFKLTGDPLYIEGVRQILDEMIYNIVDNAIKYNVQNGKVNIAVRRENEGTSICISDTGIGIPYADQQRVFERFYRVDKSHSKEIGGTGLGLSIVKHAAAFHNAQLKLSSVPGSGTVITVIF